ncbi:WD40 repeat domain-containing protein [Blastopirellula sp. JC732]|uniref:WD40 repeat domain-containing protein n=1 Tax=Blastopirellula sediminis TaxID=2894196 RepID=A0A9X1SHG1_9BACT|nr:WD40 repeat domain-containing protein [Blastopirellula sediminis]MCC9606919.1 WD40 repeat domain-containing protein [Blastopirellula sediminis]MCC9629786.1 WD40 repeat domain-containing protein [Blastopirellula sediminis]
MRPDPGPELPPVTASYPITTEQGVSVQFPLAWPPLAYLESPDKAEMLDLRTGQSLGVIRLQGKGMPIALLNFSPDGKLIAEKVLEPGPEHVRFWSFETGRVHGDVCPPASGNIQLSPLNQTLHFAGPKRVVGLRKGLGGGQAMVIDIGSLTQPRTFPLANLDPKAVFISGAWGVSPGGKYLAALIGQALVVHDIESGQCVGKKELPGGAVDNFVNVKELVFSPDGKYLATFVNPAGGGAIRVLEWDLTTGDLTQNKSWLPYKEKLKSGVTISNYAHPLAYLPDGSGWVLLGRLTWRRDAPAPTPEFDELENDSRERAVLDEHRVVAWADIGGKRVLQTITRPGAELAATGTPAPVIPATWLVKPDPASANPPTSETSLALFGKLPTAPRFSKRPSKFAAASSGGDYVLFDLETGGEVKRVAAADGKPLAIHDVSPDGRYLVVAPANADYNCELQVLDLDAGKVALLKTALSDKAEVSLEFLNNTQVMAAYDDARSNERNYVIWNIDTGKRAKHFQWKNSGVYLRDSHLVSPGGKLVLVGSQQTLTFRELESGAELGKIENLQAEDRLAPERILAGGFTLDGTKLYLLADYSSQTTRLITCNLVTSQATFRDLALGEDRQEGTLDPTPWLRNEAPWLVSRYGAVDVNSATLVPHLGLKKEASLYPLGSDRYLLGHVYLGEKGAPAAAITPISLRQHVPPQLAASVEALRPQAEAPKLETPPPAAPTPEPPKVAEMTPDNSFLPPRRPGTTTPPATTTSPSKPKPKEPDDPQWIAMVDPRANAQPLAPSRKFPDLPRHCEYFSSPYVSPFLLVVDTDADAAKLLDLAKGTLVGAEIPFPHQSQHATFDRTGAYVAYEDPDGKVLIFDVQSGASKTIDLGVRYFDVDAVEFSSDQHLIVHYNGKNQRLVGVWKPEGGEPIRTLALSSRADRGDRDVAIAVSPGGRYLAALDVDRLRIFDLTQRGVDQETPVPFPLDRYGYRFDGIAFSPDGRYLAASYAHGQFDNFAIWSMESGELLVYRPTTQKKSLLTITHSDKAAKFVWLPDGKSLLLDGTILIEATTGCPYWVLAQEEADTVQALTSGLFLYSKDERTPKGDFITTLSVGPMPKEAIAAYEAVRKSTAVAAPPLTRTERYNMPPPAPKKIDAPTPIDAFTNRLPTGPIVLSENEFGTDYPPRHLAVSGAGVLAAQIETVFTNERHAITEGPLAPEKLYALATYDMASNKKLAQIDVPEHSELLDISPDGTLLLTGDKMSLAGFSRLDVWAPQLGRHAVGWRAVPLTNGRDELPTWAGFVDKTHVLVLEGHRQMTMWRLPACEPIYSISASAPPSFSPNRRQFLNLHTGTIHDSLTGQTIGQLAGVDQRVISAAYSADGQTIVGKLNDDPSQLLVRWDVPSGEIQDRLFIPVKTHGGTLVPLGDQGVFQMSSSLGNDPGGILIDWRQKQVSSLWKTPSVFCSGPEDRIYVVERTGHSTGSKHYARSLGIENFSFPQLALPAYAVVEPGSKVALEFQSFLPQPEETRAAVLNKMVAAGFTIDPTAAVKFKFSTTRETTMVPSSQRDVQMPLEEVVVSLTLFDAAGNPVWGKGTRGSERLKGVDLGLQMDSLKWAENIRIPSAMFQKNWTDYFQPQEWPKGPTP